MGYKPLLIRILPTEDREKLKQGEIIAIDLALWALLIGITVPFGVVILDHSLRHGLSEKTRNHSINFSFTLLWQFCFYFHLEFIQQAFQRYKFSIHRIVIMLLILAALSICAFKFHLFKALYINLATSGVALYVIYIFKIKQNAQRIRLIPDSDLIEIQKYKDENAKMKTVLECYHDNFLDDLDSIIGKDIISQKTNHISTVDRNNKEDEQKLSHISYLNLHRNNLSLHELANYASHASANKYPRDRNSSFELAVEKFKKVNNEHGSIAWSINMINPSTWLMNADWETNYVRPLLYESFRKDKVDIRRIHVLLVNDYNKDEGDHSIHKSINTILFNEQLAGIDNKILRVDKNNMATGPEKIGVTIANIFLLDFALYDSHPSKSYFDYDKKIVLCSDVVPYFEDVSKPYSDQALKLYLIKDFNNFNIFKENFLTTWYFNEYIKDKSEYSAAYYQDAVTDFFSLVKEKKIREGTIIWDKVVELVEHIKYPTKNYPPGKTHVMIAGQIKIQLMNKFDTFVKSGVYTRKNFEKIFKGLIVEKAMPLPTTLY